MSCRSVNTTSQDLWVDISINGWRMLECLFIGPRRSNVALVQMVHTIKHEELVHMYSWMTKLWTKTGTPHRTDAFQTNSLLLNGDSLRPVPHLRLCKQACLMCSQAGLLVAINKHLQSHKSHWVGSAYTYVCRSHVHYPRLQTCIICSYGWTAERSPQTPQGNTYHNVLWPWLIACVEWNTT